LRPSNEELISAYESDLESDIRTNAEEIANGRTDLAAYDAKCRAELAAIRAARNAGTLGVDQYGVPSVAARNAAEREAVSLLASLAASLA